MNWFQENKFLAGLIAVVLLGGGVAGYFIYGAASRFAEVSQSYDSQAGELVRLTGLPLYPSQTNVEKLSAQRDEFKARMEKLRERLRSMAPEPVGITPPDFQAKLRERVDAFTEKAKTANVALPENFYLGFDSYRTGPPSSDSVASALNRQLDVIEKVLEVFIAQRVAAIRAVSREPLPEERGGGDPQPGSGQPRQGQGGTGPSGRPGGAQDLIRSVPFEISILAEQDRVRRSLNAIAQLPYFVPIRSLIIKNTNPTPPKRTEFSPATPTSQSDLNNLFGSQSSQQTAPAQRLEFIVGTERVELDLKLEYTLFP